MSRVEEDFQKQQLKFRSGTPYVELNGKTYFVQLTDIERYKLNQKENYVVSGKIFKYFQYKHNDFDGWVYPGTLLIEK